MNVIVGVVAMAFGCWLLWLAVVRRWHWVYGVLGLPMFAGGLFLILVTSAKAEPASKPDLQQKIEQWLWPRRDKPAPAPVPVPTPRPQNEAPAPSPPPPVVDNVPPPKPAPAPDADPPKPPPIVIKPQPEPVLIAPQPRHPRVKDKPPPVVEDTPAPRPRVRKPAPQTTGGPCFFPISCSTVCSFARAGSNQRGTPCQNAMGLACIRSTCPDVLKKRR